MNISWKFEEDCLKNEGGDRYLVIFKFFKKIDPKNFTVNDFLSETFYKKLNISKVKQYFWIL